MIKFDDNYNIKVDDLPNQTPNFPNKLIKSFFFQEFLGFINLPKYFRNIKTHKIMSLTIPI